MGFLLYFLEKTDFLPLPQALNRQLLQMEAFSPCPPKQLIKNKNPKQAQLGAV